MLLLHKAKNLGLTSDLTNPLASNRNAIVSVRAQSTCSPRRRRDRDGKIQFWQLMSVTWRLFVTALIVIIAINLAAPTLTGFTQASEGSTISEQTEELSELQLEELYLLMSGNPLSHCTGDYSPPRGYYNPVDTTNATTIRASLHELIDDHHRYSYGAIKPIVAAADEHPLTPEKIIDVYKNTSLVKDSTTWSREHTWPSSYGFGDEDDVCNYPYTDCHHIRACDPDYNTDRGNKIFNDCTSGCSKKSVVTDPAPGDYLACAGPDAHESANWMNSTYWEVWCGRKGDVARGLFYLDVRYEGGTHGETGCNEPDLILTNNASLIRESSVNQSIAYMGLLDVLIQWHLDDPVDDCERRRNSKVFQYQRNRNPFVDHPEWVCLLFAAQAPCDGQPTFIPTATPYLEITPTPTAVVSPTPPIESLGVSLSLSQSVFYPGDHFLLLAEIINPGPQTYQNVPFAVLLDAHGAYFWYPDWSPAFNCELLNVGLGRQPKSILDFQWPEEYSFGAGILFYGALLTTDASAILGDFGTASFGWTY